MLDVGRLAGGGYLVAGLNIGLDALSAIPLAGSLPAESCRIEILAPEGHWEPVPAVWQGEAVTLDLPVPACTPFVLRLTPSTRA